MVLIIQEFVPYIWPHFMKFSISDIEGITRSAPFLVVTRHAAALAYDNISLRITGVKPSIPY